MDTAQEALFRAMLNNGWFVKSDGNVNTPHGYFGYMVNISAEVPDIYDAFESITEAYGRCHRDDLIGAYFARITSDGMIDIRKYITANEAQAEFETSLKEYLKWCDS